MDSMHANLRNKSPKRVALEWERLVRRQAKALRSRREPCLRAPNLHALLAASGPVDDGPWTPAQYAAWNSQALGLSERASAWISGTAHSKQWPPLFAKLLDNASQGNSFALSALFRPHAERILSGGQAHESLNAAEACLRALGSLGGSKAKLQAIHALGEAIAMGHRHQKKSLGLWLDQVLCQRRRSGTSFIVIALDPMISECVLAWHSNAVFMAELFSPPGLFIDKKAHIVKILDPCGLHARASLSAREAPRDPEFFTALFDLAIGYAAKARLPLREPLTRRLSEQTIELSLQDTIERGLAESFFSIHGAESASRDSLQRSAWALAKTLCAHGLATAEFKGPVCAGVSDVFRPAILSLLELKALSSHLGSAEPKNSSGTRL